MQPTMIRLNIMFLLFLSYHLTSSESDPPEKRLMEHLFKNYTGLVRPSKNANEPINVSVGMAIESLADVDDKEGTVTVSGWIDIYWRDEFMIWDPNDYENVTFFIAPSARFWRPDLAFSSSIGERFFATENQLIAVTSDGTVNFAPGGRSTHSCDLDMTLFPFDIQKCKFVVITWFSGASFIQLQSLNLTFDATQENEVWKITGTESVVSSEGAWGYGIITFTMHMKRKPLYYVIYVIFPLLMLALLNLMVFRLPPEADEKMSLAITVLLAFSIWLLMLNDLTPRSSETIPILGIFIIVIMMFSAMSAIITVYVLRIHHRDEKREIPSWAIRLIKMCKLRSRGNPVVKAKDHDDDEQVMSWILVAEAVDSLSFMIMAALTVFMILTCSFSVLAIKYK